MAGWQDGSMAGRVRDLCPLDIGSKSSLVVLIGPKNTHTPVALVKDRQEPWLLSC